MSSELKKGIKDRSKFLRQLSVKDTPPDGLFMVEIDSVVEIEGIKSVGKNWCLGTITPRGKPNIISHYKFSEHCNIVSKGKRVQKT